MGRYEEQRKFLKSNFNEFKNIKTDKMKGISQPDATKPYDKLCEVVALPQVNMEVLKNPNIYKCIAERRSTRFYSDEAMSIEELSYLLWATQGITGTNKVGLILRTVPCSGATHSFETYLFIMNVEGIKKGVYRYDPIEHRLLFIFESEGIDSKIDAITLDQPFVPNFAKKAAVIFAWSTTPYRSEWKFDITAHKKILIDIGHVCQNLYLASESVGAGTCAIGIYDQKMIDELLELDGDEEFVIYLAAVGKKLK
ncbi:SagB/ThcOx family dehydrogenase [Clostridium saccharoperbutylacetonicum]|uniref:SagB-type dehydrogenase n=1 Tax=Clostridium saccharoperbutylacetonicum N1-4(HMT) TaxID=931276 RepID=M1M9Z4_9CLOT|nr:SagB/ThcOx family dehydrogenase [Clostridium saccharoperbutylacetonicum]AGF54749.1 SagB-type dehydrogenase [Clostridium saccharoperbutylacetonicum N1-4(HMT)]AQR93708.1 nitroreductase family protein [Clostridium saccharoperbutylacetonicum]NRT58730.1 SagB-type dehydrogenase family enzyme [Clostridium saccharoperbutylacetonicum]NSB27919.1 SagB-type dehydrogenase family enzyme [Clostridium saccharoperbutylacetonicum]NSB29407.1 SagB-type dehydrogenase family enzyme [Clostridium saccharoperbutyla